MSVNSAMDLLADVRRWNSYEWDLRDIAAETYWAAYALDVASAFDRAIRTIDERARGGDQEAIRATDLLRGAPDRIQNAARTALERETKGEQLDEAYFSAWSYKAKLAVFHAVVAHVGQSWIGGDYEKLTSGYKAAEDKLDFEFTLTTRSRQHWDEARSFLEDVIKAYPGTNITFDPPEKSPPQRFDVIGMAYVEGDSSAAQGRLERDLEARLRREDPERHIEWPPADFKTRRPRRFWVR